MRHAVMVSMLAMRALPRGRAVPRRVARLVMRWLDHRRMRIDAAGAPAA